MPRSDNLGGGGTKQCARPLRQLERSFNSREFFPRRTEPVCLPPQVAVLVCAAILQLASTCTAPDLPTASPEEAFRRL